MTNHDKAFFLKQLGIDVFRLKSNEIHTSQLIETSCSAKMTDLTAWEQLKQTVANCTLCPLHQTRTQTVFGVGTTEADLLIVGEAPGEQEDLKGEPFVGRAGQLLDAMLYAIGLHRKQIYIANILKCRPPRNRDPEPTEVATCTPYLDQQVALLKPKLILALGRFAAHYLLNTKTSLSKLRTQMHLYQQTNIPLIVSFHPAYLLRSPGDKGKAYVDLLKVKELLDN